MIDHTVSIAAQLLTLKAIDSLPLSKLFLKSESIGIIPSDFKDVAFLLRVLKVELKSNLRKSTLTSLTIHLLRPVLKKRRIEAIAKAMEINRYKAQSGSPKDKEINYLLHDLYTGSSIGLSGFELKILQMNKRMKKRRQITPKGYIDQRANNKFNCSRY